ncbi:MAG: ComEC family competence protein [Odoribacteraceae bacterium]|jgi:competence protein ComEC|nr:ComEC family competence protein [Odoribacteraceae bacterium]
MARFNKYPFLVLLLPVIAGIAGSECFSFLTRETRYILIGSATAGLVLSFYMRRLHLLLPLFAGMLLFTVALSRSHSPVEGVIPGQVYQGEGECVEVLRQNRYIIRFHGYNLYLQSNDTLSSFIVGDRLAFSAKFFPLKQAADVHEFDYDRYLRQLDIHFRVIPVTSLDRVGHVNSLYALCQKARSYLNHKLTGALREPSTRALLQALCLGDRSNISPHVQTLFKESGTVHLLAVSGLHTGAIYLLLTYVTGFLGLPKRVQAACVLPFLWMFAGITGLSPSAVRAATILSFVIVGQLLGRDYKAINALCASAFFTLLLSPHLFYSVSFQMSYAAYAGIILILPLLHVERKKSIFARGYSLFALSLSAQIGTLPLIAYYFHTINLNSVLINIVLVPIASCLLYIGVILLALPGVLISWLAFIPVAIYRVVIFLLEQYNRVAIQWYELYPTTVHLLFFYAFVLLGIVYLKRREMLLFRAILGLLLLFLLYRGVELFQEQRHQEVVIYDRYRQREVLLNDRGYYTFLVKSDSTALPPPYAVANRLKALPAHDGFITEDLCFKENCLVTPRLTLYIADRQHTAPGKADILLITNNLYPDRLSGEIAASTRVIVDRSNSFACTRGWEEWSKQRGIPIEKTGESGPIVIPIKKRPLSVQMKKSVPRG